MEQRYRIRAPQADVETHIRLVASSFECGLEEPSAAGGLPTVGDPRRIDVMPKHGGKPIARIELSSPPDGTHILITDQPHSDTQGRGFDSQVFDAFRLSLIAQLAEYSDPVRLS
jgi:hypothetical protein